MDHVEGLRKIVDKSEELAAKAAKAAIFAARGIYETDWDKRLTLLEPLQSVLIELVSVEVRPFDPLRALNGSTFYGFGADVESFMKESSSWPRLAKVVAARTLTSAALKLPRDEADKTYNLTALTIVNDLKYTWISHGYSAVVYYSYTGPLKSDVVFHNERAEDAFDESAASIKVFVKRYVPDDTLRVNERWKSVKMDPATLADLFNEDEPSTSMTERFRTAKLDTKLFGDSGFRAAAVLPCTYRFVWYELAWQYFHAYGTTSPYVLTFRGKNAYKPCGVVVLFP